MLNAATQTDPLAWSSSLLPRSPPCPDALELPRDEIVLLSRLIAGRLATVI
jgi:hypothetical protein